ncbi:hypothetical protein H0H92_010264 [Tricholoma furcatifolium]|nr:hypothetical protein H0H92_010264 [Tricholoma furcatifolium]
MAIGFVGRGTRVFSVYRKLSNGDLERQIVKDSWILESRKRTEEAILLAIPQFIFLPKLQSWQQLGSGTKANREPALFTPEFDSRRGGKPRSGYDPEACKAEAEAESRIKRRIVSKPLGVPLSQARSATELAGAFLDLTRAIEFLKSQGIMHRDISFGNVLLREEEYRPEELSEGHGGEPIDCLVAAARSKVHHRPVLLIDPEYAGLIVNDEPPPRSPPTSGAGPSTAAEPNAMNTASPPLAIPLQLKVSISKVLRSMAAEAGIRTGTAPFMAVPLLLHAAPHQVSFDLESLFYVLLYVCTHYDSLNPSAYRDPGLFNKAKRYAPIGLWFLGELSFVDLGCLKFTQLHFNMESLVLDFVNAYFKCLVPTMRKLWHALYPRVRSVNGSSGDGEKIRRLEKKACMPRDACDDFIFILSQAILGLLGEAQMPVPDRFRYLHHEGELQDQEEYEAKSNSKKRQRTGRGA